MTKDLADTYVEELRYIVPAGWSVEARNTEVRPGKPEAYKVIAQCGGMAIIVAPQKPKTPREVNVTINNGPGVVETLSPLFHKQVPFATPKDAFDALKSAISARYARVADQFDLVTGDPPPRPDVAALGCCACGYVITACAGCRSPVTPGLCRGCLSEYVCLRCGTSQRAPVDLDFNG